MKTCPTSLNDYLTNLCTNSLGGRYYLADLVTLTLIGGTTVRWTTWSSDLDYDGNTYISAAGFVERTRIRQSVGLEADSVTFKLVTGPTQMIGGVSILQLAASGALEGGTIRIDRLFMDQPGDVSLGAIPYWWLGEIGKVNNLTRMSVELVVHAKTIRFNQPFPRNHFQPSCRHVLFDGGCTLDPGAYQVSGSVLTGSTTVKIVTSLTQDAAIAAPTSAPTLGDVSGGQVQFAPATYYVVVTYVSANGESTASPEASRLVSDPHHLLTVTSPPSATGAVGYNVYVGLYPNGGQLQNTNPINISTNWQMPTTGIVHAAPYPLRASSGYFTQGRITFTSGPLNGISRFVSDYPSAGTVVVTPPLPSAPTNGTTFDILPGCDKTMVMCKRTFNNLINFGGQPYVPAPEQGI